MLFTIADIKEEISPFVAGGMCPNNDLVLKRLNEAVFRLITQGNWFGTIRTVQFFTRNNTITLPREFIAARFVDIDAWPSDVFSSAYEYIENGPGFVGNEAWGCSKDLITEPGTYATFFTIPSDFERCKIVALSTNANDVGKCIAIKGRKMDKSSLLTDGLPGVSLPISHWTGGEGIVDKSAMNMTDDDVFEISSLQLPDGRKDYVTIYAYAPTSKRMYFLGKYHPDETIPAYRRYRISNPTMPATQGGDSMGSIVRCLCKVQYVKMTRDDDICIIQNMYAIRSMVQAIKEELVGNTQMAAQYEGNALRMLRNDLNDSEEGETSMFSIRDTCMPATISIM